MISTYVRLTPADGGLSLTLPMYDTVQRDAIGNLTFTYTNPLVKLANSPDPNAVRRLLAEDLSSLVVSGVQQLRNRMNVFLAVTDVGGELLDVEYTELDVWQGKALAAQTLRGVVTVSNDLSGTTLESLSLIVLRAEYRYQRGVKGFEGGS